ncbi:MAG: hypothetical protein J6X67_07535, partial [Treponema sp.]|nr:hypothetical protein [Treponema sp.]
GFFLGKPTRDWRGGERPLPLGNGGEGRNPGKPVAQRGVSRNLAKEWMVERIKGRPKKNEKVKF